jgi:lysyl-tRNA synthetase class 2
MLSQIQKVEKFLDNIRSFYKKRGYTEVVTPYLLPYPNLDDNIFPITCEVEDISRRRRAFYLHTSPEYSMKKLLAETHADIFQICHVFRNREGGKLNDFEFLMLEYYKVGVDYTYLMDEIGELLRFLFGERITYKGKSIPTTLKRVSLKDAFKNLLGLELKLETPEAFKEGLKRAGIYFEENDDIETLFFRAYIELERKLGFDQPTVVYGFPEPFGALSRCKNGWCERFELYIFGIELANAYTEVNNPEEVENRLRKVAKELNLPVDERFIEIHKRLPPLYSGISIGLDRLLMLYLGLDDIHSLYFRRINSDF